MHTRKSGQLHKLNFCDLHLRYFPPKPGKLSFFFIFTNLLSLKLAIEMCFDQSGDIKIRLFKKEPYFLFHPSNCRNSSENNVIEMGPSERGYR